MRQSQTHFDFVQLASDTQHEAQEFEKPRFSTHDCMHEVPEMMHRTAQPCTEPWSESNLEQVDATSLSAWQSPWANGSSASIAFTASVRMVRDRELRRRTRRRVAGSHAHRTVATVQRTLPGR